MELMFLWLFFGIATAIVASNKGRSVGGWAVLGLLFGVFALIIVALVPKVEA